MKNIVFQFNLRHWLFGINWDASTVDKFTCRFLCVHFGPWLLSWNLSDKIEWVVPKP